MLSKFTYENQEWSKGCRLMFHGSIPVIIINGYNSWHGTLKTP